MPAAVAQRNDVAAWLEAAISVVRKVANAVRKVAN